MEYPDLLRFQAESTAPDLHRQLSELVSDWRGYDPDDLLSAAAALQLVPANAHHGVRMQAFAHVAACLPIGDGRGVISRNRLTAILHASPLGDGPIRQAEDPFDGVFVDSIMFFGGEYLVIGGETEYDTYTLHHLCQAIFQHTDPFSDGGYAQHVYRVVRAGLALSDSICRRVGLTRGSSPPEYQDVAVPPHSAMEGLKQAVRFTLSELVLALKARDAGAPDLRPLTVERGSVRVQDYRLMEGPLLQTPLVRSGDCVIVAAPTSIAYALRQEILRAAVERNVTSELAKRFHGSIRRDIRRAFRTMDHTPVEIKLPEPPKLECFSEFVYAFDTDQGNRV